MENLINLKKKYNALLERNSKAETYLNNHNYAECKREIEIRGKGIGKSTFDLFNEVVIDLSKTKKQIETMLYRNMTDDEIWNGFKV